MVLEEEEEEGAGGALQGQECIGALSVNCRQ